MFWSRSSRGGACSSRFISTGCCTVSCRLYRRVSFYCALPVMLGGPCLCLFTSCCACLSLVYPSEVLSLFLSFSFLFWMNIHIQFLLLLFLSLFFLFSFLSLYWVWKWMFYPTFLKHALIFFSSSSSECALKLRD